MTVFSIVTMQTLIILNNLCWQRNAQAVGTTACDHKSADVETASHDSFHNSHTPHADASCDCMPYVVHYHDGVLYSSAEHHILPTYAQTLHLW